MASAAQNRRGIIAMVAAMSLFVGNDAFMKLAREVYPTGQAIAIRSVFAIAAGLLMVWGLGEWRKLSLALRPRVIARGLVESVIALTFFWSLGLLPLANITSILMASPLIIVVLAVALGIEKVGWRRTSAIGVGFVGVLIVVRPTADSFEPAALVALFSAVLVGVRDLMTRAIGNEIPSPVISLTTSVVVGLVSLGVATLETWQPIWRIETLYLALAAVLVAIGGLFSVSAFRNTDVGIISGYRYTVVVFAVLIGYVVWREVPDFHAVLGILLIVGSGLYTLHRQRVKPDLRLKPAAPPP